MLVAGELTIDGSPAGLGTPAEFGESNLDVTDTVPIRRATTRPTAAAGLGQIDVNRCLCGPINDITPGRRFGAGSSST